MNENAARFAVRGLIIEQASYICGASYVQGKQRMIGDVSVSVFSEPRQYPFIRVACSRSVVAPSSTNTWMPRARYSMEVLVTDQAMLQGGDVLPYETMDMQFRDMCDRIVDTVMEARAFSYGGKRFMIPDDDVVVTKENQDGIIYSDNNTVEALILGSVIRFDIEECL